MGSGDDYYHRSFSRQALLTQVKAHLCKLFLLYESNAVLVYKKKPISAAGMKLPLESLLSDYQTEITLYI